MKRLLKLGYKENPGKWLISKYLMFSFHVYECFASVCTTCKSGAHGGQKSASDLLEMEFQVFVNQRIGSENQSLVSYKSSEYS